MILPATEGQPPRHIPVPEHRTESVQSGESVFIGVLTNARERKVVRVFQNAPPSPEDEVVPTEEVPGLIYNQIQGMLDNLERIYFPASV